MAEIQFVPGAFESYRTTTKIHLGKLETDLKEGDVIQFDGQVIKIGGVEHYYPELRAAFKVGWVVEQTDNISNYIPKASDMKIRAAQDNKKAAKTAPVTVTDDETHVGPARPSRNVIRADDVGSDGVTHVRSFSRDLKQQDQEERNVGPSRKTAEPKPLLRKTASEMKSDSVGNEDSVLVGKIRTPAVSAKTTITDVSSAAQAAAKLDNTPPPRAILNSKGGEEIFAAEAETVEEILPALDSENRARIVREQRRAQAKASDAKIAKEEPAKASPVKVASKVAPKAVEKPVPAKATPPAKKVAVPVAKAAPAKAAVPAKPVKKAGPQSIEQVILAGDETDLGGGLKWDMTIQWLKRVNIALTKYQDNPEAMAKILAVESPAVVKVLSKAYESRKKA